MKACIGPIFKQIWQLSIINWNLKTKPLTTWANKKPSSPYVKELHAKDQDLRDSTIKYCRPTDRPTVACVMRE